ncbi:MAG: hypothetical protein Q4G65_17000 [bacterium]|nr:hypothetical protein [bacterium]
MELSKTRSDAWGEDLPEETRWEIYGFTKPAREGDDESRPHLKSYEDAREHAAARGITPPSRAGWYRFLARMRREEHLRLVYRVQGAGETATDLAREAGITDATAAEAFRALSVNAAMDGDDKGAALYALTAARFKSANIKSGEFALRERAQATKEEQLRLEREKFEYNAAKKAMEFAAEIKTVAADDGLDDDEKIQKVREALFG